MLTNNYTQDNCTQNRVGFQLVLPINVETLIPEDDSVRTLSQTVEELNLSDLMLAYSSQGRNPVVPPVIMLKIMLYAYMQRIYSSREIEKSCHRDINFKWLLSGYPVPDHNTICRFRSERLQGQIEPIFNQFIMKLYVKEKVFFRNLFIDGTKIEANANKYTFVWKKATEKNAAKLPGKVAELLSEINAEYGTTFTLDHDCDILKILNYTLIFLELKKEEFEIVFVYGKGKRKDPLQRFYERILEIVEKQEKYDYHMRTFGNDRNSFSKTDTDATFMHMKEDHMRNSQLKPGYNLQIGVENGYIVGVEVLSDRNDVYALKPMLKRLHRNFPGHRFDNVILDAGYESEENYDYLNQEEYAPFVKPSTYEAQKKKGFKKRIGRVENMEYDEKNDEYICAKGRRLKPIFIKHRKTKRSDYVREGTVYECENCDRCGKMKSLCKKSKYNKRVEVSKKLKAYQEESLANITSKEGIILRTNRSIQAEGAFGVMKEDYGFRRFLTRGKENVFIECMLMCFSHNINKLHNQKMGRGNKEELYIPDNLDVA